ncbi:MAG: hypothetical protein IPG25_09300 [Proteobacteria bacterium]|nr:hypothetical protein [Pseudomonadota bacterium]
MKKVSQSPRAIVYRHQPTVMLFFAAMCTLILGGSFVFAMLLAARLVMALFVVIGFIVGLGRDQLTLDLARRELPYDERLAGFVVQRVKGDFDEVEAILLNHVSVKRPEVGVTTIHPALAVVLKVYGQAADGHFDRHLHDPQRSHGRSDDAQRADEATD